MEIWKDCSEFKNLYQVSNLCRIRSLYKSNRRLTNDNTKKLKLSHRGYYIVQLVKEGNKYTRSAHRLMAIEFIPNPNNFPILDHINDIKTDNRLENLEWVSYSENQKRRFR